ncbi:MAG: hypothetical protein JNJ88_02990 [Planctomycetes bacterium]|nr:hypothetical protein [Planctomycetota bacterium]
MRRLAEFFDRNGYARWQSPSRREKEGWQRYKKGDEVRLVASSAAELEEIRDLLRRAGIHPGRPFVKGRQFGQPIYGRQAVEQFFTLIERPRGVARGSPPKSARPKSVSPAPDIAKERKGRATRPRR